MYIHGYTRMHRYLHANTHTCVRAYIHKGLHTYAFSIACMHARAHALPLTHASKYACTQASTHARKQVRMHASKYACTNAQWLWQSTIFKLVGQGGLSTKVLNVQEDNRCKGIQGNTSKSEIKCVCLNARCIINKKTELNIMVDDIKPHIRGIT